MVESSCVSISYRFVIDFKNFKEAKTNNLLYNFKK